jgi:hypothetical protein
MKDHSLENTNFDIHTQIHTHMKLIIATKPNICSNNGGVQEKRKDRMNDALPSHGVRPS